MVYFSIKHCHCVLVAVINNFKNIVSRIAKLSQQSVFYNKESETLIQVRSMKLLEVVNNKTIKVQQQIVMRFIKK